MTRRQEGALEVQPMPASAGRGTQTREWVRLQQLSPRSECTESQAGLQPADQRPEEAPPEPLALKGRGA